MILVTLLFSCVGVALFVPILVLFTQVSVAFRTTAPARLAPESRPRVAILVPAHDESSGLLPTLRSVLPQLLPQDRCLVVADNCSDDTAQIAAGAGSEVVERVDPSLRGKGYAIDFGMRALASDPPAIVIVVDADCLVDPGAISRLARLAAATARPVQALYLMRSPPSPKRATLIAEFAWRVKNWARPLGYRRLGLPCPLMGTGMAFPWASLGPVDVATGHIAEDMKLGIDLAKAGTPPLFCPEAVVWSVFPANEVGARSQRTRWEHGHLALILSEVPSLLGKGFTGMNLSLIAMALDLLVPPVALLVMLAAGWALFCTVLGLLFPTMLWPMMISLAALSVLAGALGLAWLRFGKSIVPAGMLALAIFYALRKIPLYIQFLFSRQAEWIRSKRDGH